MDAIRASGGRLWLMEEVLNAYGDERYLRAGGSGGVFRPSAENWGQARRLAYGAGTMALVCLGRSFQPLICCWVRIQTAWPAGGAPCPAT